MTKTEQAVYDTAKGLLKANNTTTTLEIKNVLRQTQPNRKWFQSDISDIMDDLQQQGKFNYSDNGKFRVYSAPVKNTRTTKAPNSNGRISRSKAIDMIENSAGHFFTVTFTKKDGSHRVMNCQYSKQRTQQNAKLGYITVVELSSKTPKNVNTQTLASISMGGVVYKIR